MTEPSKYNIQRTEVFQVVEKNDGTVIGKQAIEYQQNSELQSVLKDLKNTLAELQKQHPNVTQEAEAIEIIDAEIAEPSPSPAGGKLALLREQLLNPERHFQATKATVMEVAKHYLDETALGKGFVTYLNTLSSKPEQGA